MRYEFTVGRSCRVKTFLKEHDISKGLLAKIKFEGGHIWVNGEEQFATYPVHEGDVVAIEIPDEAPHETLKPIPFDLDIVYEDDNPMAMLVFQVLTTIIPWLILSNIILSAIIIPTSVCIL